MFFNSHQKNPKCKKNRLSKIAISAYKKYCWLIFYEKPPYYTTIAKSSKDFLKSAFGAKNGQKMSILQNCHLRIIY